MLIEKIKEVSDNHRRKYPGLYIIIAIVYFIIAVLCWAVAHNLSQ